MSLAVSVHVKILAGIPLTTAESEWLADVFDRTPLYVGKVDE